MKEMYDILNDVDMWIHCDLEASAVEDEVLRELAGTRQALSEGRYAYAMFHWQRIMRLAGLVGYLGFFGAEDEEFTEGCRRRLRAGGGGG